MAIAFIAYVVKGFSGFGPALIVVPALSVIYSPQTALATSCLIDLVVGAALVFRWRLVPRERAYAGILCTFVALGAAVGAALAGVLPERWLLGVLGLVVMTLGVRIAVAGSPALPPDARDAQDWSCWTCGRYQWRDGRNQWPIRGRERVHA